uniref:Uncharacterized protein n=1 Tax=Glycine max TaxID=3847 RepID=C6T726_SOYBN|nr:unknown [Glycine max]
MYCINRLKDFGSATAILLVLLLYLVQQICTFSRKESVLYGRTLLTAMVVNGLYDSKRLSLAVFGRTCTKHSFQRGYIECLESQCFRPSRCNGSERFNQTSLKASSQLCYGVQAP